MTKLFIANVTKQKWVFTYRLPGGAQHFRRDIAPGAQICLDHLQSEEIEAVVKQNAVYGCRKAGDLSGRKGFATLLYSLDNPVRVDPMLETFETNDAAKTAEADERRKRTATAMAQNIADTIHRETGAPRENLVPERLEVETIEESTGKPLVSAGVEVLRDPNKTAPRRARM